MSKSENFLEILIFYYFPVFLWMILIFYLSSISGLKTGVESIGLEIFFRKIAHLLEYFVLTFLVWRVFQKHFPQSKNFKKTIIFSFIFVLLYAISDEIHQYFVDNRAGRMIDVLTDSCGSFLSLALIVFWSKKINK